jgi:hypothetical protein
MAVLSVLTNFIGHMHDAYETPGAKEVTENNNALVDVNAEDCDYGRGMFGLTAIAFCCMMTSRRTIAVSPSGTSSANRMGAGRIPATCSSRQHVRFDLSRIWSKGQSRNPYTVS